MGYRLDIDVEDNNGNNILIDFIGGTKLYAYAPTENLKSAKFLQEKGYIENAESFVDKWYLLPTLKISVADFKIFAKLYNNELDEFWNNNEDYQLNWWINKKGIQQILQMPDNYKVVLNWG